MRVCAVCGKAPQFGQNIRHVHSGAWELKAANQATLDPEPADSESCQRERDEADPGVHQMPEIRQSGAGGLRIPRRSLSGPASCLVRITTSCETVALGAFPSAASEGEIILEFHASRNARRASEGVCP